VVKLNPQGRVVMVLGRKGQAADNPQSFNRPTDVAFAANGDIYVADGYVNSRVVKFSKEGKYLLEWGKKGTGDGEFNLVHDVAVDAKGRVYIADRENRRVQVFDAGGRFLAKWADVGSPWGLAYYAKENVLFLCDGYNNRIVKLNTEGQVLGVLSSYGKEPGKLDFAHNIAVDSRGDIYVAEIKNWRVQKFAQ
jgi:DNA-binding beta-propeller fold protein YncE